MTISNGTKSRSLVTLASAYLSDRYRQRALSVIVPACIALTGFAIFLGTSLRFKPRVSLQVLNPLTSRLT